MKWTCGAGPLAPTKRLKTLEDENTRLKRLPAEGMLDNPALKDLVGTKW